MTMRFSLIVLVLLVGTSFAASNPVRSNNSCITSPPYFLQCLSPY